MSRLIVSLVLCFTIGSNLLAGISVKSEYSYDQKGVLSFEGSEEIVGNIERTVTLPNAIYKFDIVSDSEDVYELKSKTMFDVNIDGRAVDGFSGDGWFETTVRASSTSQLVDTTIVDGLQGQVGGFVEFLWDITGASTIELDPKLRSDGYRIRELFTTALFNPLEDSAVPELLLNDQSFPPLGTKSINSVVPDFVEPVVLAVDWIAGEELDVFFELQTSARLSIQNLDAAGFTANVASDFGNTGTLKAIRVYDDQGEMIPNAYLRSLEDNFIYDPENLGLGGGSDPIQVDLDIRPSSEQNSVWIGSKGFLPVAVLGSEDLDVSLIDMDSLLLADPELLDAGGTAVSPFRTTPREVSEDSEIDLLARFNIRDLARSGALNCESTEAVLTGELMDGTPFVGSDVILVRGSASACDRFAVPQGTIRVASVPEPSAFGPLLLALLACLASCRTSLAVGR